MAQSARDQMLLAQLQRRQMGMPMQTPEEMAMDPAQISQQAVISADQAAMPQQEGMLEAEEFDFSDAVPPVTPGQEALTAFDEDADLANEAGFAQGALAPPAGAVEAMPAPSPQPGDLQALQLALEQYRSLPQQTDYTALAGFADYLDPSGRGKALETAKALRPETRSERAKKIFELENMLEQRRLSRELLPAKLAAQDARTQQAGGRQERFETSQVLKKEDTIRKDVGKLADEYGSRTEQIATAKQTIANGGARDIGMVLGLLARSLGGQKGAISDRDVAYFLPPDVATNLAQLQNYFGQDKPVSPELRNALIRLAERGEANAAKSYKDALTRRKKAYSSGQYQELMQPGQVGEIMINEAESILPPAAPEEEMNELEELRKKARGK